MYVCCMYVCMYVCVYVYMYAGMYVCCMYVCMLYMYVCMYVWGFCYKLSQQILSTLSRRQGERGASAVSNCYPLSQLPRLYNPILFVLHIFRFSKSELLNTHFPVYIIRKTLQNKSGSLNIHMHIYTLLSIYGLGDWQPALEKQEWGLKRF